MTDERRLERSRSDRWILGVCGGVAKYLGVDPTIVRVIAALSMFLGGSGVVVYLVLALVIPEETTGKVGIREVQSWFPKTNSPSPQPEREPMSQPLQNPHDLR